jgi:hypothetical protein
MIINKTSRLLNTNICISNFYHANVKQISLCDFVMYTDRVMVIFFFNMIYVIMLFLAVVINVFFSLLKKKQSKATCYLNRYNSYCNILPVLKWHIQICPNNTKCTKRNSLVENFTNLMIVFYLFF